ncbi:PH domain-containing protein [Thomasclavelia cocleata]|uniref:PH domain-containing protein n=1 Tax=Thomasclavelia cocleata TaxID=69824 RepID=A0A1I0HPQ1_9FIRM|nr:PH domain-containing protein [Thomasclavelia cocleata]MCR1961898.1 PH domain-containing protein [Thomasclavelia cocleata]NDO42303.1 PH domain-containing protein [Thomasclavelia cocleata]SET85948.1 PH domain-containing protein [Thomasclavelia cocleata]
MDNKVIWQDRKHFMWFPFSFTKYQIKNERLYQETGLISTHYDELLLYRITDLCLQRNLAQKIFGTGTIILYTKADSSKEIHLKNIKNANEVKDLISSLVEEARDKKKIVGKEFFDDSYSLND